MKTKKNSLMHQLLILLMGALVLALTLQMAQAQNQVSTQRISSDSLLKKLKTDTTFNYYHQFSGPTLAGNGGESYNVFQEARTPYQSFHAASLRHQVNSKWATGISLAGVAAYGTRTTSMDGFEGSMLRDEFFNARLFVTTPSLSTPIGTLFTTLSYEAPTSVVARRDDMRYGLVLAQSFAFKLPAHGLSTGLSWQFYRAYYQENVKQTAPADFYFPGSIPEYAIRQTVIINAGPFMSYRFNDYWGVNSSITFDWDQRGNQTSTTNFNNNLPDRARLGVSYFPNLQYLSSVGLFTQGLLKYRPETQVLGAEFALIF